MAETVITCPNCGTRIPISEALSAQIREETERRLRKELEASLRAQIESRLKHEAEAARSRWEAERRMLEEQLAAQRKKAREAEAAELALRKRQQEVAEKERDLELQLQRRLDAERRTLEQRLREQQAEARRELEARLRRQLAEEQDLKLKEKEKQIEDLRRALEDAKRRSELGSQELQGEVLELDLERRLRGQFPHDRIEPVPKGVRGADLIHTVFDTQGRDCGRIVWETKNTKHWQPAWLAKLKDDQRACNAGLAVLVSVALPDGVHGFARIDGVWVCDPKSWPALAVALREQLIRVAFAHAAAEGKQEKMELLYQYLAGDQFRQRVQGIVEAFTAMQDQLARERRAMERIWREREKQIERVVTHTVGMYGEMRGLIGATLPAIPALELDDGELPPPAAEDGGP